MNIHANAHQMLRELLQAELREFATFCSDNGISDTIAASMMLANTILCAYAVATDGFKMSRADFLRHVEAVLDKADRNAASKRAEH